MTKENISNIIGDTPCTITGDTSATIHALYQLEQSYSTHLLHPKQCYHSIYKSVISKVKDVLS